MTTSKSSFNILWVQVWVLAAVQGAITLSWLIYNSYLPQLLTQFGFPASFAIGLLVVENALGAVLEPLMGGFSDQTRRWVGTRFPLISVGVILASALFIAIPCFVSLIPPTMILRSLLPITLVAWALAMTIFRSPAICLLGTYSTPAELPLAASIVSLTGGLIGAFRPIANKYILNLGPVLTFAIGSFVLLGAVAALRFVNPPETPVDRHNAQIIQFPLQKLALILGTGFGVAWGIRFLMDVLGKVLKAQLNTDNIDIQMVGIGIAIAVASIPAGMFAVKIGNRQAMLCGICATIPALLMMAFIGVQIPIILLVIAGFSLIVNGVIPFALGLVPQRWAGLGIGTYFGGFAAAMSLFGAVFPQPQTITPFLGAVAGAMAFFLAGVCIVVSGISQAPTSAEI
ncbi:MFS transporter [Nostoc linckia z18]|uniref:MFS transporter n=2 Tax=Nostoc linckia TaxID=92942 RepID=A0A9Q6EHK7_NOSLI|nr:MFS transporter [Nostoc linckia]PHK26710.1 MFS transporter [Nostoc linckia z15]PHK47562.1 MFS transporter [Nostoc linckia z16]PHJ56060.1 MFS transporter [Nostoc linckia z3]PHJ56307.1 MFS transporter [Nostoc linckia z1]PHJ60996.1 MFS transporter [Nostoc linckia z2]